MVGKWLLCFLLALQISTGLADPEKDEDTLLLAGLTRSLEANPQDTKVRLKRALYYLWRTFDYASALEDLDLVLELEPRNATAYIARADVYTGWDARFYDPLKAKADAEKALEIAPESSEVFRILGDLPGHPGMGTPDDSFRNYQRAVQLDPNNLLAQVGLAYTYSKKGTGFHSEARALNHAQKAFQIAPDETLALEALGDLLTSEEGTRADGLKLLNRAIRNNQRSVGTFLARGYTYLTWSMDDEWDEILRTMQRSGASVLDTIRGNDKLFRRALRKQGKNCRLAKALQDFERAEAICPHSSDVFSARAYALQNFPGQERNALQAYNRVVELSPKDADALVQRAEFLMANPQLMIDPKAVDDLDDKADLDAAGLGELIGERFPIVSKELEGDLTKALELAPSAKAYYLRGSMRGSALRNYKGAIADLTEAIALEPLQPNYYEARASVHEGFGHDEEAEADRARISDLEDLD